MMGYFNIILLKKNKILLDKQYYDFYTQAPTSLYSTISAFPSFFHQLNAKPTRTTKRTKTLIAQILKKSPEKVFHSGVIEMG